MQNWHNINYSLDTAKPPILNVFGTFNLRNFGAEIRPFKEKITKNKSL